MLWNDRKTRKRSKQPANGFDAGGPNVSLLGVCYARAVYQSMAQVPNPYGNGQAGEEIARILAEGGAWHLAGPELGQPDR